MAIQFASLDLSTTMTEQVWLDSRYPTRMLAFLRGKRKLRLFVVACCHRLFPLYDDARALEVVEAAERFADGKIGRRRLRAIFNPWFDETSSHYDSNRPARAAIVDLILSYCLTSRPRPRGDDPVTSAVVAAKCTWWNFWERRSTRWDEWLAQCDFLRDIVGNPFQPVEFDANLLQWNDALISKIAQSIYDNRRFADLPILADTLEDAGCTNAEILNHCRSDGPHVRGCWVVDLILGKQ